MAQLKTHKYVSALPSTLEASAIYFVRTGSGFDLYVTNNSGTIVAYTLNANSSETKGLSGFFSGKPVPTQIVASGIAPYNMTITEAGSSARARVAATGTLFFSIKRDGSEIGTIVFSGGTVGVVTMSTTNVTTAGQYITVVCTAPADATLEDITILLKGT